jgi:release factor glutamine methyltransferase
MTALTGPTATWTIRSLLVWMSQDFSGLGIATARLDAELLIAHVLGLARVKLYMDMERPLTAAELSAVRALVVRRRQREPVAYLIGQREFYRRTFEVSSAVLIPRPDTECLVEHALSLLPSDTALGVLDLCTGSGAIAVTLAAERPLLQVVATDLSPAALAVARSNGARHAVSERLELLQGDLFDALPAERRFDLIVANPPYIGAADFAQLAPELLHEPRLALVAEHQGLAVLTRLCERSAGFLSPAGALLFEVGLGQAEAVTALLRDQPGLRDVRVHKDLGGIERVVEAHAAVSGE